MASAFEGVAQTVPEGKYATSANEMPKFMQDAIYNQIQLAQNIAQTPYQEYNLPLVAELTPDQQQAFADIRASQGSWQPGMEYAQQGMAALSQAPGQSAAAQPYFQQVAGMSGMQAAQPALQQQANLLGGINYNAPASTLDIRQGQYLSPELANYGLQQAQQAYGLSGGIDIAGAASPYIQRAAGMSGLENAQGLMQQQAGLLGSLNYNAPTSNLSAAQNAYLNRDLANAALQAGQTAYQQAGQQNIAAAADPYLMQQMGVLNALNYNAPTGNLAAAQNKYLSPELAQEQLTASKLGLQKAAGIDIAGAAQPYLSQQVGLINALDYNAPTGNLAAAQNKYLSPELAQEQLTASKLGLQKAAGIDIAGAAQPYLSQQVGLLNALDYNAPTSELTAAQNQYLSPELAAANLQAGQQQYGRAANMDVTSAAQPYLQQAAQTSAAGIGQYMNPYQEGVMNALAQQSARNLSENLLPAVSDAFIRAGQFGGSRMGEFGSRAVRDTQEALLNQQAQVLQQGYGQALTASQADLARQAQLASTAGQLTGQQQAALTNIGQAQTAAGQAQQQTGLTAAQQAANARQQAIAQAQQTAAQLGQVGAQQGQLTGQQQSALANISQAQAAMGQAQQQTGLTAAQQVASAQQQALAQAQQSAAQLGQVGAQQGQLAGQQQAALTNISQAQAAMGQAQQQTGLSAAQQVANAQQQAIAQAQQTAAQIGQVGAQRGQLTAQQLQALTNLGQAQTAAGQAQQQAGLTAAQQVANAQQQALAQAQASAAQYGQLAGQVGSLTGQQQQLLASLGQTAGQLTGQQASHLLNLGQAQAAFGQAQQQAGLGAAQNLSQAQQQAISQQLQGAGQYGQLGGALGALTADQQRILAGLGTSAAGFAGGDINTQMSALSNIASLAQAQQGMAARDAAALEAIGQTQQAQQQQQLSAAYQQQQQQQLYQQQMADWLSTQIRGMAPITPQQTTTSQVGNTVQYGASPLSQLAGAYGLYKGLTG